jgi:hypothetical protein
MYYIYILPLKIFICIIDHVGAQLLRMLRMARLAKLMRIFRIGKMESVFRYLEENFGIDTYLSLAKLFLVLAYTMHLVGCAMFFVGSEFDYVDDDGNAMSWIGYRPTIINENTTLSANYTISIYWAMTTIVTVGYGDIIPVNDSERLFMVLVMIIGASLFGYVIGNVSLLIDKKDLKSTIQSTEADTLKEFCISNEVPRALQKRLARQLTFTHDNGITFNPIECLSHLPPTIIYKVMAESTLCKNLVLDYAVFAQSECSNLTLSMLLLNFKPFFLNKADKLYDAGGLSMDLYLINTGTVFHVVLDPKSNEEVVYDEVELKTLFGFEGLTGKLRVTSTIAFKYSWGLFIRTSTFKDLAAADLPFRNEINELSVKWDKNFHAFLQEQKIPLPPDTSNASSTLSLLNGLKSSPHSGKALVVPSKDAPLTDIEENPEGKHILCPELPISIDIMYFTSNRKYTGSYSLRITQR